MAWSRRNYAPVLFLSINGDPSNDLLGKLINFTYKRSVDKAAETRLTFRNDSRTLADDPRFLSNTPWQFRYGYFNDLSPIITGIIRNVEPVYEDKCTITVTLFDHTSSLGKNSSGKNWGRVPSSRIAAELAKKYGMQAQVDDSNDRPAKAFVQPATVNDLQYLRDLAADIDFEVFVDGTPSVLYYRAKPYDGTPHPLRLIYYDDPSEFAYVKKFAPKVKSLGAVKSGAAKTNGNKGKGESASSKDNTKLGDYNQQFEYVFTPGDTQRGEIYLVPKDPPSRDTQEGVKKSAASGANVNRLSSSARSQMLDKANEASSDHPLTPSIIPGRLYEWAGLESSLNRKWYCSGVTHTISGTQASTSADWKRDAPNKNKNASKNGKNNKDPSTTNQNNSPYVELNADNYAQTYIPGTPNSGATK